MEFSLLQIVIAFLGSSGLGAGVLYLAHRRKTRAEGVNAEGASLQNILDQLKMLMSEKIEDARKLNAADAKNAALEVLVRVKDAESEAKDRMIKEVTLEQGRQEQREHDCNRRLSHAEAEIDKLKSLTSVNTRLQKDVLLAVGTNDEKRRSE